MTEVRLKGIHKEYEQGVSTIPHLDLTINKGELLVLVGPSGCGKSTVLRMIAGLEDITSGELFFNDEKVNDAPAKNRDIGMVFQNYALYPHLTVAENLAFPLTLRKIAKQEIDAKVREVAKLVGLDTLLERKPKQLSGGQRQRVALGRAIIRTPKVFLFDEPLSNLDAQLRVQMRAEIVNLQKRLGVTGIYVTHDQAEAMTMGDRIAVLHKGELMQIGTPSEIYSNPQSVFVAGFLGSPTMNFFTGSIKQSDNGYHFQENAQGASFEIPASAFLTKPDIHQEYTLGIRPEHCALQSFGDNSSEWKTTIEQTEYHGHEMITYMQSGGTRKAMRTTVMESLKPEKHISIYFDPNAICMFSTQTGKRV